MTDSAQRGMTVVIPAFNEEGAIAETLTALKAALAALGRPTEILVVDDGSSDATGSVAAAQGVRVIRHPVNGGYGRSLLSGIEVATYDHIAIVDADGTYPVDKLPELVAFYDKGFHMAVGARQGKHYHSTLGKRILRFLFRSLAEYTCGRSIPDINSGFRVFDRRPVLAQRGALSAGFSFTTTITLLFMLEHLFVGYLPIDYHERVGKSKVRLWRDSLRSIQIIVTAIAEFNPLKLYLLLAAINFAGNLVLAGLIWFFEPLQLPVWTPALVAWNTLCLLGGCNVIALGFLKPRMPPATAYTEWRKS